MREIQRSGARRRCLANPSSQPDLADLMEESKKLILNSVAISTRKTYQTALKKFQNFVRLRYNHSVVIRPITTHVLLNFIAYLSIQQHAASTVQLYISAIAFFHKLKGLQDPTNNFLISKALQDLKRTRSTTQDSRCPITFHILLKITASLPTICSPYEVKLFSCAFSLAYFALLRVGECTVTSYTTTSHHIQFQGIEVRSRTNQVRITILHSKTQQTFGQTLIIQGQPHSPLGLVRSIMEFLKVRPTTPPSQIFLVHNDTAPLTRFQFNAVLQKSLKHSGTSGYFGTHSFRIGRATDMALQGVPYNDIQKAGRWRSPVFQSISGLHNH